MRKLMMFQMAALLALALQPPVVVTAAAPTDAAGDNTALVSQARDGRGRRGYRRRGRGIGTAYRRAGVSAARGGARFGKNMVRGRPVRASKSLGKGAGGFGKHTGVGTARVGKKLGRGVKKIF